MAPCLPCSLFVVSPLRTSLEPREGELSGFAKPGEASAIVSVLGEIEEWLYAPDEFRDEVSVALSWEGGRWCRRAFAGLAESGMGHWGLQEGFVIRNAGGRGRWQGRHRRERISKAFLREE